VGISAYVCRVCKYNLQTEIFREAAVTHSDNTIFVAPLIYADSPEAYLAMRARSLVGDSQRIVLNIENNRHFNITLL